MDHLVISNAVDSTGVVSVAGVVTADMWYFSGIFGLAHDKATEKIGYNNFRIYCSYCGHTS